MNISSVNHKLRLQSWYEIIKRQQDSGMTVKDWCDQNDVSRDQYYYWKRALKEACFESLNSVPASDLNPALPDIVPLVPMADSNRCTTLKTCTTNPTPSTESSCDSSLRLNIADISIDIFADTSAALITRVIKAVRDAK